MENVHQQVRRAKRRLNLQRFLTLLPACWSAALFVAVLAIAVHKWYPTAADPWLWNLGWLSGALVVGLVVAAIWTRWTRHQAIDAAMELDRRFGLKERVSSSLALSDSQRDTEVGRAVVNDAEQRVRRLDVTDRFDLSVGRGMLLPILPALLAFGLALVISERAIEKPAQAGTTEATQKKQVKKSSEELRKKVENRRKELRAKGLKEAEEALKEFENGLRDLNEKKDTDRKNAMIKLNNLANKLEHRQKQLGGADEIRRQLDKLKDLKQGPADKLARALKKGKFKDALDEVGKLQQKLRDADLNDEQKQKLQDQLDQMKQKLDQVAQAHQQAKQDLQQQIDKARQDGDRDQVAKMQNALDKLQQQTPQMNKLSQMAKKLGQAAQAMKDGQNQQAQQALDQLADDLQQLKNDSDQMEALEATLDEIRMAKNSMKCEQCGGAGCGKCQGGDGFGDEMGDGSGKGQGQGGQGDKVGKGGDGNGAGKAGHGDRAERKTATNAYDSKVKGKVGKGRAVITGPADGPNIKGQLREEIQAEFDVQKGGPADPLSGQRLPKSYQRHVQEYLESIRKGD